jgi:hypothetical protein
VNNALNRKIPNETKASEAQNLFVSGLYPSSGIVKTTKQRFGK